MRSVIIIILFAFSTVAYTQEWKTISQKEYEALLQPMKIFFEKESYSFHITYRSFIGHGSEKVYDEQNGVFIKSKGDYFSSLPGQFTIQDNNLKAIIDSIDKEIAIMDAEKSIESDFNRAVYEFTIALTEKIEVKEIAGGKIIRLNFVQNSEMEGYEISLDNKGRFLSLTTFYSEKVPFDPDDENSEEDKLKFSILFSEYKTGVAYPEKYRLNKFITSTGTNYQGSGMYKNYEISDYRLNTNAR